MAVKHLYSVTKCQHHTAAAVLVAAIVRGRGKGGQLPLPTGPGLDPEVRANPVRSVIA